MLSPFASMVTSHESPADIAYGKTKLEVRAAVFGMSKNTRNYGTAGRLEHPSEIDLLTSALLCRSVARAYAVVTVHNVSTNQLLERSDREGCADISVNAKARNRD